MTIRGIIILNIVITESISFARDQNWQYNVSTIDTPTFRDLALLTNCVESLMSIYEVKPIKLEEPYNIDPNRSLRDSFEASPLFWKQLLSYIENIQTLKADLRDSGNNATKW